MHNGFVQVNAEKMSKSLGNFKTIRDILASYLPETLRFFLLGKHYRSPIDFTADIMDESEKALQRIYECQLEAGKALERAKWKKVDLPADILKEWDEHGQGFNAALDDDVNTAQALGHIFSQVRLVNRVLEDKALRAGEGARRLLEEFFERRNDWSAQLGLFGQDPATFLLALRDQRAARLNIDVPRGPSGRACRGPCRQGLCPLRRTARRACRTGRGRARHRGRAGLGYSLAR